MDPTPQKDSKIDQDRTALSRTLNSLALAVQSSVFGGLGFLAHDLTLTERRTLDTAFYATQRCAPEASPLHLQVQQQQQPVVSATFFDHQTEHQQQRPWYKKKYRVIVQEIPDDEDNSSISDPNMSDTTKTGSLNILAPESDTVIASSLLRPGSSSSSSPTLPPGLLDWLLFTTHEDSFFRHLGRANALARQAGHCLPDVAATSDTQKTLSCVDAHTSETLVMSFQAVPESTASAQSNIAMALATEINHSATPMPETPNEASAHALEPSPVVVHKQHETAMDTTSVRGNGSEGGYVQDAVVPCKVNFEDMDLQTPWWKKRQHREQERQSWISNQKDKMPVQEAAKDKTSQRAEETLDLPNLRRGRFQGESVGQPKTLETFVKTTVSTRPDGAIESKTVKDSTLLQEATDNLHKTRIVVVAPGGPQTVVETETRVKVLHPDGSVEETVSFKRDNSSACVRPSARTRREHRQYLRQQERERREQVWQAQQERQQLQREQQEQQHEQQVQQQARQQEQLQQQKEQPRSEPNVENDMYSQATRSRIRERWAKHRQESQDSDQAEPSLSRTRSRSWPPKGYLRRQSQSEQAEPHPEDQRHDVESSRSTWPPKGYLRRQEREQ
ncbi:hypothetical protein BG000_009737 [Podila horticola]|nr:hypothetical protein BG000_009737 [Podila horticola]